MASAVRKQREAKAGVHALLLIQSRAPAHGIVCRPHSRWVFLVGLASLETHHFRYPKASATGWF